MIKGAHNNNDLLAFAEKLKWLKINFGPTYEMLPLCGIGIAVAFEKFKLMTKKIYYASEFLLNAYKKEHYGMFGQSIHDDDIFFKRGMYFEIAVGEYGGVNNYV